MMTNSTKIKEVFSDEYTLVYAKESGDFLCSGCNQEKDGKHMLHSIFFKEYTDTAPICMNCISEDILK